MSASPTVNLPSLELVSTLRVAPLNGPPSSNDYNDTDQETIIDLTTLLTFLNNILMPMLNTLAADADNGIEGSNIFGDTTSEEALFYNVLTEEPMVIADSLRFLYGQSQSIDTLIGNLGVQVAALQARLSSTNQNDVRSEEHTSELQSLRHLVCRLLLEK